MNAAFHTSSVDALTALFKQNNFPESWLEPDTAGRLDALSAAQALPISSMPNASTSGTRCTATDWSRFWETALEGASQSIKATLEMLAKIMGKKCEISVYTLEYGFDAG